MGRSHPPHTRVCTQPVTLQPLEGITVKDLLLPANSHGSAIHALMYICITGSGAYIWRPLKLAKALRHFHLCLLSAQYFSTPDIFPLLQVCRMIGAFWVGGSLGNEMIPPSALIHLTFPSVSFCGGEMEFWEASNFFMVSYTISVNKDLADTFSLVYYPKRPLENLAALSLYL